MKISSKKEYFGVWKSKSIIKSRDELCQDLEEYESLLNDYVMSLLQNIIDLKISATEPYNELSESYDKLYELDIYKDALMYNIYNRALNIFKESDDEVEIEESSKLNFLYINSKENHNPLYRFDCGKQVVSLYKTILDEERRKENIEQLKNKIEFLRNQSNPWVDDETISGVPLFGGPASRWGMNRANEINNCEELLKELEKKEYTDKDYKDVEITDKYYKIFCGEYGVNDSSFNSEDDDSNNMTKTDSIVYPHLTLQRVTKFM